MLGGTQLVVVKNGFDPFKEDFRCGLLLALRASWVVTPHGKVEGLEFVCWNIQPTDSQAKIFLVLDLVLVEIKVVAEAWGTIELQLRNAEFFQDQILVLGKLLNLGFLALKFFKASSVVGKVVWMTFQV